MSARLTDDICAIAALRKKYQPQAIANAIADARRAALREQRDRDTENGLAALDDIVECNQAIRNAIAAAEQAVELAPDLLRLLRAVAQHLDIDVELTHKAWRAEVFGALTSHRIHSFSRERRRRPLT